MLCFKTLLCKMDLILYGCLNYICLFSAVLKRQAFLSGPPTDWTGALTLFVEDKGAG